MTRLRLILLSVLLFCGTVFGQATEVGSWQDLANIADDLSGDYILTADLDATSAGYAEHADPTANGGGGWIPLGDETTPFTGSFDGDGHTIADLTIDRDEATVKYQALFGYVSSNGSIQNLTLTGAEVTGWPGGLSYTGILAGYIRGLWADPLRISNVTVSGTVSGGEYVGGLAGYLDIYVTISRCAAVDVTVSGGQVLGGLVGRALGSYLIEDCYATGSVTGGMNVGGFVGTGRNNTPGAQNDWAIRRCWADVTVDGVGNVGGFVGKLLQTGMFEDCYATGSVTGTDVVGGFAGLDNNQTTAGYIRRCYATGLVTATDPDPDYVGGFIGQACYQTDYANNFWDVEASGITRASIAATPKTTVQMQQINTFTAAGWDIATIADHVTETWSIDPGNDVPRLRWEPYEEPKSPPKSKIASWQDLAAMATDLSGNHVLMADLDANSAGYAEHAGPTANDCTGWLPLGDDITPFTGTFDGNGKTIRNLTIDRNAPYQGLFGCIGGNAVIQDLTITDADITGYTLGDYACTGILAGFIGGAFQDPVVLSHVTVSGRVSGGGHIGGCVGAGSSWFTISHCAAVDINVSGSRCVGGFIGHTWTDYFIEDSFATGFVSATTDTVGGFVAYGRNEPPNITAERCYAETAVEGRFNVGGFVGQLVYAAKFQDCYATGNVTASDRVGGFAGADKNTTPEGAIRRCYATGLVTATDPDPDHVGGFIGQACYQTDYASNFWDIETSGISSANVAATGKTTTEMQQINTFTAAGWDIATIADHVTETWRIDPGNDVPRLAWVQWLDGWSYRKKITIDSNRIDAHLVDFPVIVFLESDPDVGTTASPDGHDLRFTQADGQTLLDAEPELWSIKNGHATGVFHVRIPSVPSDADSSFYLYYGKPTADAYWSSSDVWDTHFVAVYHMDDLTASSVGDSTIHANDGTKAAANEPVEADAWIGKGQDFDGTEDGIDLPDALLPATGDFTVSLWINQHKPTGDLRDTVIGQGGRSTDTNRLHWYSSTMVGDPAGHTQVWIDGPGEILIGSDIRLAGWHHLVLRRSNTTLAQYCNGRLDAQGSSDMCIYQEDTSIGCGHYLGSSLSFLNGQIDEVRISNTARSEAWIKAEYHSGADELIGLGPQQGHRR